MKTSTISHLPLPHTQVFKASHVTLTLTWVTHFIMSYLHSLKPLIYFKYLMLESRP